MSLSPPKYFDVLKSVITKQKIQKEHIDSLFVPFVVLRWLAGNPKACMISNIVNSARGNKYIKTYEEYLFLKHAIKLPKNTYIAMNSKEKYKVLIINKIASIYQVGITTAESYANIMGKDRVIKDITTWGQLDNKYNNSPEKIELKKAISLLKKGSFNV